MNRAIPEFFHLAAFLCCTIYSFLYAEKVLVYDSVKGIIFVDKKQDDKQRKNSPAFVSTARKLKKQNSADLHIGRKKDPPELYFKSGLEYFENGDYKNALKNFSYADSLNPDPLSMLWKAKTHRQMGDIDKMLFIMQQIIEFFPESDVADDALFELALHYQKFDDYERSVLLYTRLAEQYPFGLLYATGEELREIARKQRNLMRAELISLLSILGFSGNDLVVNLKKFQKNNSLEITGAADQETVRLIRAAHKQFLFDEKQKAMKRENTRQSTIRLLIASGVCLITLTMLVFLQIKIRGRSQHLGELRKILADLDLSKL